MLKSHTLNWGFFCCLVLFFLTGTLVAQMAKPLEHPLDVYVDSESKSVYWPKDKQFWVRLATSPEDNAPSFLLKEVTSSDLTTDQYFSQGIQLEIDGRQFIRWYNHVTKDTVMLKFYADAEPPVSKVNLFDAPVFKSDKIFYGKGLKGTLESTDELAGVADIFYSIDGDSFMVYRDTLIMDREKPYNLRYYAVDNVGYAAGPETVEFTVDLTPPVSQHETVTNFIGDVLSGSTVFKLSSQDDLSGLDRIFFKFDESAEYIEYNGEDIELTALEDGDHHLKYYAIDKVANTEDEVDYAFYLDIIPPEPDIKIVGDRYSPDQGGDYISARTEIELSATDNKIGVDRIEYAIGSEQFAEYSAPFTGPATAGDFKIAYNTADKLGNKSDTRERELRMDINPPVSQYDFTGPHYAKSGTVWITRNTRVKLSATDDACGVLKTEYKIRDRETTLYTEPFQLQDEGRYMFTYWSYDNVNNREPDQSALLIVDNTPPSITETFSIVPHDTTLGADGDSVAVYPRFTSVFLATVDNAAGLDGIWYRINDAEEKTFKETLFFKKNGEFTVRVRSQDHVGNESSKTFSFIIRDN